MQNRVLKLTGIFLFIIILTVSAVIINAVVFPKETVIAPKISPDPSRLQSSPIIISHKFPFEKNEVTLAIPINVSVYEGAKQADKSTMIQGNVSEALWLADTYRAMVNDPAQEEMYSGILSDLNKTRLSQELSDDEYLELVAVYVQSLRYETKEQTPAKFPIETVVERAGDCDDKSLLLAGLLSHEGYQVAVLLFSPEAHMAIGVGSDDYIFKNSGYAFVESTNYSFIGVPTDKLGGNLTLYSDPVIIPINNGTKLFGGGKETRFIYDTYSLSDQRVKELEPQLKSMGADLTSQKEKIATLESQIQGLRTSGNIVSYNAQVPVHNTRVSEYNYQFNTYRQIFARYEKFVDIHNYILEHQYDRKGVSEYIRVNLPD